MRTVLSIIAFAVFFCLHSPVCFSQADSLYIESYPQKLTLRSYFTSKFLMMNHEVEETETTYMSNNPMEIGVGASINNTVLSFGYGYGFDFLRNKHKGKTESFDFQMHNYGDKFAYDIFIQRYKGFYIDEEDKRTNFELRPDIRIRWYGGNIQYALNHKRFSYAAAFNQSKKQLRSAGSALIGFGVNTSKIASDSSFVFKNQNVIRSFQIGVSGGYAYTWVIDRHWFINGSITAGINFGSDTFSNFGQKLQISPTAFPRVSAGYNREDWALGFNFVANMASPSFSDKTSLTLFTGNMSISYLYRIQSVPILSKIIE